MRPLPLALVVLAFAAPVAFVASGLEAREGCARGDEMCFGPTGTYWTLFGGEVVMLGIHVAVALLVGAASGAVLAWRGRRRAWLPREIAWRAVVAGAWVALVAFALLAAAEPPVVQY